MGACCTVRGGRKPATSHSRQVAVLRMPFEGTDQAECWVAQQRAVLSEGSAVADSWVRVEDLCSRMRDTQAEAGPDDRVLLHRIGSAPVGLESAAFPRQLEWNKSKPHADLDSGGGSDQQVRAVRAKLKFGLDVTEEWDSMGDSYTVLQTLGKGTDVFIVETVSGMQHFPTRGDLTLRVKVAVAGRRGGGGGGGGGQAGEPVGWVTARKATGQTNIVS